MMREADVEKAPVRVATAEEEVVAFQQSWARAESELSLLRRQNEKLVEALKPFAKAGESWRLSDALSQATGQAPEADTVVVLRAGAIPCDITVGHLRRAAAALRSAGAAGNGEDRG